MKLTFDTVTLGSFSAKASQIILETKTLVAKSFWLNGTSKSLEPNVGFPGIVPTGVSKMFLIEFLIASISKTVLDGVSKSSYNLLDENDINKSFLLSLFMYLGEIEMLKFSVLRTFDSFEFFDRFCNTLRIII